MPSSAQDRLLAVHLVPARPVWPTRASDPFGEVAVHRPNRRPVPILSRPDLSWGRRLVVLAAAVGLLAVACSSGGGDNAASSGTPAADGSTTVAPPTTATPKKIDVLPGMPPVTNPSNIYSDTAPKDLSPNVSGALSRVYVPNHEDNTVSVIDPSTMQVVDTLRVGINPQHIVPAA